MSVRQQYKSCLRRAQCTYSVNLTVYEDKDDRSWCHFMPEQHFEESMV